MATVAIWTVMPPLCPSWQSWVELRAITSKIQGLGNPWRFWSSSSFIAKEILKRKRNMAKGQEVGVEGCPKCPWRCPTIISFFTHALHDHQSFIPGFFSSSHCTYYLVYFMHCHNYNCYLHRDASKIHISALTLPFSLIWFGCVPPQISCRTVIPPCWSRGWVGGDWIMGGDFPLAVVMILNEFSQYLMV